MKLCHAAALALVGWYLIIPPLEHFPKGARDSKGKPIPRWLAGGLKGNGDPDFSEWEIIGSYDAAASCQDEKADLVLKVPDNVQDREAYSAMFPFLVNQARCLATDDPRLKGK